MAYQIDPSSVPVLTLSSGASMPAVGMGTFGSDSVTPAQVAAAVITAARIGYRHFDCAMVYGNEKEVGEALSAVQEGLPRRELFVTSKLWNDRHAKKDVIPTCEQSLRDLRLEYLDLYLVHWPFPNAHDAGCDVHARNENARPYIHDAFMQTWGEFEKLQQQGKVRHIGTSNMTIPKMELLLRDCRIKPAANELEMHPHMQQRELFGYLTRSGIAPIAYCPMGSPGRPERDRTPEDTVDLEDPVMLSIAARHGVHPASIAIAWAVQRGAAPIPFSTNEKHLYANLLSALQPRLSEQEMAAIEGIDRNCRLIKGQVFLWREGQDWRDLWDENGVIAQ